MWIKKIASNLFDQKISQNSKPFCLIFKKLQKKCIKYTQKPREIAKKTRKIAQKTHKIAKNQKILTKNQLTKFYWCSGICLT